MMVRNALAMLLLGGAVALFAFLVFNSRPIGAEHHRAHYAIVGKVSQSVDDFKTLLEVLAEVRRSGRDVGSSADVTLSRLGSATEYAAEYIASRTPSGPREQQLLAALADYSASVEDVVSGSGNFIKHQDAFASALQEMREKSPEVVQHLRETGASSVARETFLLVTRTIDYARAPAGIDSQSLLDTIQRLANRQTVTPVAPLMRIVRTVLEERQFSDELWAQLSGSELPHLAQQFLVYQTALHRSRLARIEVYRVLLSVYGALLLIGLGVVGYRLYHSYRVLNQTNNELEMFNQTLEARVAERTRELEQAYENLQESQVQLVQAAKMSSLGQLVAGISHEINTPLLYLSSNATLIQERLQGLSSFVQEVQSTLALVRGEKTDKDRFQAGLKQLYKRLKDGLPEDIEDIQTLISDSIEGLDQLRHMAQSLKDFSRLDRAPVETYSVNDGVEKALLIAKNVLKSKVTVRKDFGKIPEIRCSPSQINQVFLNLITNGAQAIQETGEITISTRCSDDRVFIGFTDNGCGIPEDILSKIRDPFFTTKEVGEGTGLGLSIVDKIIAAHRGDLQIDSVVGQGSTFTVILPVKPPASAARSPAETRAADQEVAAA